MDNYLSLLESGRLRKCHYSPDISPYDYIYEIYCELSTCRPSSFSIAPIPWNIIRDYADFNRMNFLMLKSIIQAIDADYIEYINGKKDNSDNG